MALINFIITDAGRALVAQATPGGIGAVTLQTIQIGNSGYTPSPQQTALQAPIKSLNPIGFAKPEPDLLHFNVQDETADSYTVQEIGIFTSTGVLFAIYSQTNPMLTKATGAAALFSIDLKISNLPAGTVNLGSTSFTYPTASESTLGVARLALDSDIAGGTDNSKIVTPDKLMNLNRVKTGLRLPSGSISERPSAATSGTTRFNNESLLVEYYNGTNWIPVTGTPYTADVLLIGGGGGGGAGENAAGGDGGGGGGGGGVINRTITLLSRTSYPALIGQGGPGATIPSVQRGANGGNTTFAGMTAFGGGGGGSDGLNDGAAGGCGGGANSQFAVATNGGSGTAFQGGGGGSCVAATGTTGRAGAGGGGTAGVGATRNVNVGGVGGAGGTFITGAPPFLIQYGGGGGGGGAGANAGGAGGAGGGGAGASSTANAGNGLTGTGGGGGGGNGNNSGRCNGGNGGSGIIIISYEGPQRGTGGVVTTVGNKTVHTFTADGTYLA